MSLTRLTLLTAILFASPLHAQLSSRDSAEDLAQRWAGSFNLLDHERHRVNITVVRHGVTLSIENVTSVRVEGRLLVVEFGAERSDAARHAVIDPNTILVMQEAG